MKRTFQPNTRKRVKKHGFMSRSASVLKNRRRRGRKYLVPTAHR